MFQFCIFYRSNKHFGNIILCIQYIFKFVYCIGQINTLDITTEIYLFCNIIFYKIYLLSIRIIINRIIYQYNCIIYTYAHTQTHTHTYMYIYIYIYTI